jgi:type IX secretion system PorP/SprF family membrane protein
LKKIRFIFFVVVLSIPFGINSQIFLNSNLYLNNKSNLNPAYTGALNHPDLYLNYRNTSASFDGAISFITAGGSLNVNKTMSLGGRFYKQSEGLFEVLTLFVDYSYWIEIFEDHKLRFGVSAGLNTNQIDYSNIIAEDPSAIIDVASRSFEGTSFQSAAGLVYNWKNLEFSLGIPKFFESGNSLKPTFQSLFQYQILLNNKDFALKPSILIRYARDSPLLYDINLQSFYKELFWIGFAYRNRPGIIVSAGFAVNKFNIGYAFETGTNNYSNIFNQIHEVSISIAFQKKKKNYNDSIYEPDDQLVLKSDSVKSDSILNKIVNNKTDSVGKNFVKSENIVSQKKPKYKIIDAGDGIFIMKSNLSDSANISEGEELSELEIDSLLANEFIEQMLRKERKSVNIINKGAGVFAIKLKANINDSLSNPDAISDELLDSLIQYDDLLEDMNTDKSDLPTELPLNYNEYFTLQLFIDKTNNYILSNADIVNEMSISKNENDSFNYFYGKFNTWSSASLARSKLGKYKNLKTLIVKIDPLK